MLILKAREHFLFEHLTVLLSITPVAWLIYAAWIDEYECHDGFSVTAMELPQTADSSMTVPKCYA